MTVTDTVQNKKQHIMSDIIQVSDINFSWKGQQPFSIEIEKFSVKSGEKILLIGPSGSGKSTFLSLLCGIVAPDKGQIHVLEKDLTKLSGAQKDLFRAENFGIIFQMFNLLPYGSILDNVCLPLSFAKNRRNKVLKTGDIQNEATRLLKRLGLPPEKTSKKSAATLSVGQQQRVAAARALIGAPAIIIADEPTSSLDKDHQDNFLNLLSEETEKANSTLMMVSHDESLASHFDKVLSIKDIINIQ